jgi:hypothetical protein
MLDSPDLGDYALGMIEDLPALPFDSGPDAVEIVSRRNDLY